MEGGETTKDTNKFKDYKYSSLYPEVDRGWSWAICVSIAIGSFIMGGQHKMSGILFVEYQERFMESTVATGWITSTHSIAIILFSPIGGYLADTIGMQKMRLLIFIMYTFASVSVALSGYMPNLPLTILLYGILFGISNGLCQCVVLSFPAQYFDKKRATAYGIVFAGGSLGSLLVPIIFTACVARFGFGGAMIILSGIWLHVLFVPVVTRPLRLDKFNQKLQAELMIEVEVDTISPMESQDQTCIDNIDNQNTRSKKNGSSVCGAVLSLLKSYSTFVCSSGMPILLFIISAGMFAYYNQYFVIPILCRELGIDKMTSSTMLSTFSGVDLIARFMIGVIVDNYGVPKRNVLVIGYAISGAAGLVVSFFLNIYVLFINAVIIGAFGGYATVLAIPMMVELAEKKGIASAMLLVLVGTNTALGPVILGALGEALGSYVYSLRALSVTYLISMMLYSLPMLRNRVCKRPITHGKHDIVECTKNTPANIETELTDGKQSAETR